MTIVRASLVMAILAAGIAPTASATERTLNEDWIQRDVEMITRLEAALPTSEVLAAVALEQLPSSTHGRQRRDLGFGVVRHDAYFPGGYTSASVVMLETDGHVVATSLTWHAIGHGGEVRRALRRALGANETWRRGDTLRTLADDRALARLRDAPCRVLGATAEGSCAPVSPSIRTLMDPFTKLYYEGPQGNRTINALVRDRDVRALRVVLRSPSPEARMHAVDALERLEAVGVRISADDRRAIDLLRSDQLPIRVSHGCIISHVPASELRTPN